MVETTTDELPDGTVLPTGVVPAGQVAGGMAYFWGSQQMAPGGAQGSGTERQRLVVLFGKYYK